MYTCQHYIYHTGARIDIVEVAENVVREKTMGDRQQHSTDNLLQRNLDVQPGEVRVNIGAHAVLEDAPENHERTRLLPDGVESLQARMSENHSLPHLRTGVTYQLSRRIRHPGALRSLANSRKGIHRKHKIRLQIPL